jgi:hydroxymethyl cephem carbamoyltransferase
MLITAFNPGHDSAVAVVRDRELVLAVEGEKDSGARHSRLTPQLLLRAAEWIGEMPDVVALGGWAKRVGVNVQDIAAGYAGDERTLAPSNFFGHPVRYFSSSHERSHVMAAIGLAPRPVAPERRVALVWEGVIGAFILLDEEYRTVSRIEVMSQPGMRYQLLFALADPTFPDTGTGVRAEDAGKLMALAAFGSAESVTPAVRETVERILALPEVTEHSKAELRDSPVHNAGVTSEVCTAAAACLSTLMFERFRDAARRHLPSGLPLYIGGGCGLNCDWNRFWRDDGFFSSVFVPPCANDSGSAVGTALDALYALTGDPHVDWDVYRGFDFEVDRRPDPATWAEHDLDYRVVAERLRCDEVVAWVQGRWEIGPRALGNRSLLASPFNAENHTRLNEIKQRESYRPIAPVCRQEELSLHFDTDFEDPYMLYFRQVRGDSLPAVTHADGSARVQSVTAGSNPRLHRLLGEFAEATGAGVLCNTSLNFKGMGFINRLSDLERYCADRGVDAMVVGDRVYTRHTGDPVNGSRAGRERVLGG